MKIHEVKVSPEALEDLDGIYRYVRSRSGSEAVASGYLKRIESFLSDLQHFPNRGTVRSDIRPGLRVIGFERSVSVGFVIKEDAVVILRILAGGRQGLLEAENRD